jgi:hypothetical protein
LKEKMLGLSASEMECSGGWSEDGVSQADGGGDRLLLLAWWTPALMETEEEDAAKERGLRC